MECKAPRRGSGFRASVWRALALVQLTLAGCGGNPANTPVAWWHDLQGGAIAERRPPPPGSTLPYPKLYTVPARPALPDTAYRQALQVQLAAERDRVRQTAARHPITVNAPPPPPKPPPPPPPAATPAGTGPADTAAQPNTANATLPAADAPPPLPASGAVTLAGAPASSDALPDIPAAPPQPATFEGVPVEPLPTPPPPVRPIGRPPGAAVLFASGSAELATSQTSTLKDVIAHRGKLAVVVEGHGDELADTPEGQAAALTLGLARARAVAQALLALHVPADAIRLSAASVGRGATVRLE